MTCISRPMPESLSSSWTSSRRQDCPLMAYSDPPLRNIVRLIVTSAYSIGSAPSVLSIVRATSARPRGGRPAVPAKMTSSILPPRSDLAPCSPITHASASTTFDLPDPFGRTMQVMPGSSWRVVEEANDLKPRSVKLLRYTGLPSESWPADTTVPTQTTRRRRSAYRRHAPFSGSHAPRLGGGGLQGDSVGCSAWGSLATHNASPRQRHSPWC